MSFDTKQTQLIADFFSVVRKFSKMGFRNRESFAQNPLYRKDFKSYKIKLTGFLAPDAAKGEFVADLPVRPHHDLVFYFAPGRVNLLGEHLDYNGGLVLPCAINLGCYGGALADADTELCSFTTLSRAGTPRPYTIPYPIIKNHRRIVINKNPGWYNLPLAVIKSFGHFGYVPSRPFHFALTSSLPSGAGLGSSAALEMVLASSLNALYDWHLSPTDLAQICQHAENQYGDVQCGIMDQMTVALGRSQEVLVLHTSDMAYGHLPLPLQDLCLLGIHSRVHRKLSTTPYNQRTQETAVALDRIQASYPSYPDLAHIPMEDWPEVSELFKNKGDITLKRRVRHCMSEQHRCCLAQEALAQGDFASFGRLMTASHFSLKNDYEVSCPELDFLVETALSSEACLGARLTGAGFGGMTIHLVKKDQVEAFKAYMTECYEEQFGIQPNIYLLEPSNGLAEMSYEISPWPEEIALC